MPAVTPNAATPQHASAALHQPCNSGLYESILTVSLQAMTKLHVGVRVSLQLLAECVSRCMAVRICDWARVMVLYNARQCSERHSIPFSTCTGSQTCANSQSCRSCIPVLQQYNICTHHLQQAAALPSIVTSDRPKTLHSWLAAVAPRPCHLDQPSGKPCFAHQHSEPSSGDHIV